MINQNRESTINSLYEAVTGKQFGQKDDVLNGRYDKMTGTYYCGVNAQINFQNYDDLKRYIQSRYFDYTHIMVNEEGKHLSEEEKAKNLLRAETLLGIMNKFNIPTCDFSKD